MLNPSLAISVGEWVEYRSMMTTDMVFNPLCISWEGSIYSGIEPIEMEQNNLVPSQILRFL
jgi:hypothetical protein